MKTLLDNTESSSAHAVENLLEDAVKDGTEASDVVRVVRKIFAEIARREHARARQDALAIATFTKDNTEKATGQLMEFVPEVSLWKPMLKAVPLDMGLSLIAVDNNAAVGSIIELVRATEMNHGTGNDKTLTVAASKKWSMLAVCYAETPMWM